MRKVAFDIHLLRNIHIPPQVKLNKWLSLVIDYIHSMKVIEPVKRDRRLTKRTGISETVFQLLAENGALIGSTVNMPAGEMETRVPLPILVSPT